MHIRSTGVQLQLRKNELIEVLETKSIYFFGCLACILIFFQARFALKEFEINLNLADILAIATACIFMLEMRKVKFNFLMPHTYTFLILTISVFTFAFLNGIFRFGFVSYVFIGKFLGLFILIGYGSIGVIYKSKFGETGLKLLINIMLSTLLIIMAVKFCMNPLYYSRIFDNDLINPALSGYTNNRNAFALQLLCTACLSLIYMDKRDLLTAILFAGVVSTYSRSALITMFALAVFLYITRIIEPKRLLKIILLTLVATAVIFGVQLFIFYSARFYLTYKMYLSNGSVDITNPLESSWYLYSCANSDSQRLYTIKESLKLWWHNPFMGIGLGGFVQHELLKNQIFLVIHNTFLWILVEFGLIGASAFIWYAWVICKFFYAKLKTTSIKLFSREEKSLLLVLLVFASMGNAHELFYQRIVWLIIGLLIVMPEARKIQDKTAI